MWLALVFVLFVSCLGTAEKKVTDADITAIVSDNTDDIVSESVLSGEDEVDNAPEGVVVKQNIFTDATLDISKNLPAEVRADIPDSTDDKSYFHAIEPTDDEVPVSAGAYNQDETKRGVEKIAPQNEVVKKEDKVALDILPVEDTIKTTENGANQLDKAAAIPDDKVSSKVNVKDNTDEKAQLKENVVNTDKLPVENNKEILDKQIETVIAGDDSSQIKTAENGIKNHDKTDNTKKYDGIFLNDLKKNDKKIIPSVLPEFDFSDPSVSDYTGINTVPSKTVYYHNGKDYDDTGTDAVSIIDETGIVAGKVSDENGSSVEDKLTAYENSEVNISIENGGWLIEKFSDELLTPVTRKNYPDRTWVTLKTGMPGAGNIQFVRYDIDNDRYERRNFTITVKEREMFGEKNKKSSKKNVKKAEKTPDYRKVLADNFYADGSYSDAVKSYEQLIEAGISDGEIFYKLGKSYYMTGNKAKAIENLNKNLSETGNPFYEEALIDYIMVLKEDKKYIEGIDAVYKLGFSKGVESKGKEQLYLLLGDLYFNIGNYPEATRAYKTFISGFPDSMSIDKAMFYLAYSLELKSAPDYKEAGKIYRSIIERFPESKYINLSRSRILHLDRHYLKVN